MSAKKSKASRTMAGVPADVLAELNAGTRETGNLMEGLALDFGVLLRRAVPGVDVGVMEAACKEKMGILQRMQLAARLIAPLGKKKLLGLRKHRSDTVRGWVCYALMLEKEIELSERLELIRPLADDAHFGVREWAWLALRPHVAGDVVGAVKLLTPWAVDKSVAVRRFASEVTRPRGVWCGHLDVLKKEPKLGLPILEPLKADESKYVQDSVANWLNDASKTHPKFVIEVTRRWSKESPVAQTTRIVKRATRSLA